MLTVFSAALAIWMCEVPQYNQYGNFHHSIYWSLKIWKAPIIELYCPLTPFTLYPQWQYTYVNFIKHISNFNKPHMGLVKATFKSQSRKIVASTLIYVYQKSWYFELLNNFYCILNQWSMVQEWSVLTLSAMQCKTVVFWGKLNIIWAEPYYDFAHKAGVQMNPFLFKSPPLGAPHPKNAAHPPTHPSLFIYLFIFVKMILSMFNTDALMVLVDMSGHSG